MNFADGRASEFFFHVRLELLHIFQCPAETCLVNNRLGGYFADFLSRPREKQSDKVLGDRDGAPAVFPANLAGFRIGCEKILGILIVVAKLARAAGFRCNGGHGIVAPYDCRTDWVWGYMGSIILRMT